MKDINRKKWAKIEMIGLILVMSSFLALIFSPDSLSNLFNCITAQVFPIVVDVFLTKEYNNKQWWQPEQRGKIKGFFNIKSQKRKPCS